MDMELTITLEGNLERDQRLIELYNKIIELANEYEVKILKINYREVI